MEYASNSHKLSHWAYDYCAKYGYVNPSMYIKKAYFKSDFCAIEQWMADEALKRETNHEACTR